MTEQQFEGIFREYFTVLSNIAYSVVKDEDAAKDIVQQVFIKLWNKKNELSVQVSLKAYLHRATVNTAINAFNKSKKLVVDDMSSMDLPAENNPTQELEPEVLRKQIKAAIEELPEKCAQVFSLSRYSGMSNKEIADYLHISIKAVEKHIGRALKELRITLKPLHKTLFAILIALFLFFR